MGINTKIADDEEDLFELDEWDSDDGLHHVVWGAGVAGYPVWMCQTHNKPYFVYCIENAQDQLSIER